MQEDQLHPGLIGEMIDVLETRIVSLNEALTDLKRLQSISDIPLIGTGIPVRDGTCRAKLVACLLAGTFTLASIAHETKLTPRMVKSKLSQLYRRNGIDYAIQAGRFQIVLPPGLSRANVISEPRIAAARQQKTLQGAFFYVTDRASTRRAGSVAWKLCQVIKDQPGIRLNDLMGQAKQLGVHNPVHLLEVDVRRGEILVCYQQAGSLDLDWASYSSAADNCGDHPPPNLLPSQSGTPLPVDMIPKPSWTGPVLPILSTAPATPAISQLEQVRDGGNVRSSARQMRLTVSR